jgi:outer membrane protein assembly factor BamB
MRGEPGTLPPSIPPTFGKYLLVQAIRQDGFNILFYGSDYSGGRFVAVQREDSAEIVALFDFEAYAHPPGMSASERAFAAQRATWAALAGSVLLVGHAHHAEARGGNAFITALDLDSGELLWRSAPLVANAADFVVHRGHVFSGYGAGAEPGHLYVLDAVTGKTVSKTRVKSGPDYLFLRTGQLLVRCYDTDYVFELRHGGG